MNTAPTTYAIRVDGHLDDHRSAWLAMPGSCVAASRARAMAFESAGMRRQCYGRWLRSVWPRRRLVGSLAA